MDEEEKIIDVERKLVGRQPYHYALQAGTTTLEADSGFGKVGAKMDPKTGALMYERYEDWITKQKIIKEEIEESNIRFSDDSSAMIHFREKEEAHLAADGSVVDHKAVGIVSVENRSEKDRLWDISVGLRSEGESAYLDFRELTAKELDPKERESREYGINIMEPTIALEEVISTHPDYPESLILVSGKSSHVGLQLGLKNLHTIPYKDLLITKAVPKELRNIIFPGDTVEDVMIEDGKLLWKIPHLNPGEIRILRYEGDLDPQKPDRIPTGDVEIRTRADDLITTIIVDSFEAMCRNMYFIEADETDEPGEWICRFVVENTSQFEVEILRVEVQDPRSGEVFVNLDGPRVFVPPEGRWESDSWVITNKERPSFIKNLLLNVIPGLHKEMTFQMKKEGGDFYPARLSFRKSFDTKRVEAKRETDVGVSMTIENTGDAELEQLFIRDSLPKYLMAPSPSSIRIEREGEVLTDNIGVHVEPVKAGPLADQQLFIRIDDLSRYGGPLGRSERINIYYTTRVFRPEPETTITSPAEVDARPYLSGPVISGQDVAGAPTIETHQVLRKFSVGKSIEQGSLEGLYNIQLLYRNRGNQPVMNLTMKDIIPENFSGSGFTSDPVTEPTPEGMTILKWNIDVIPPGESVVISYTIKGQGEYHPRDAQIFYNATTE
ncbi:MAG: hypothetical protein ACMUIG_10675 [Thermoplasmatota archaeon]